jgi:hypothetical protein
VAGLDVTSLGMHLLPIVDGKKKMDTGRRKKKKKKKKKGRKKR